MTPIACETHARVAHLAAPVAPVDDQPSRGARAWRGDFGEHIQPRPRFGSGFLLIGELADYALVVLPRLILSEQIGPLAQLAQRSRRKRTAGGQLPQDALECLDRALDVSGRFPREALLVEIVAVLHRRCQCGGQEKEQPDSDKSCAHSYPHSTQMETTVRSSSRFPLLKWRAASRVSFANAAASFDSKRKARAINRSSPNSSPARFRLSV